MKTREEHGIRPAPLTMKKKKKKPFEVNSVCDARNGGVLTGGYTESLANASLIAAAPDLYKCLYDARPNYVPFSFRLDKYQPPRGLKKGDVVNVKFRIYGSKTLDKPARAFHMTAASMTVVYPAGMFAHGMEADE